MSQSINQIATSKQVNRYRFGVLVLTLVILIGIHSELFAQVNQSLELRKSEAQIRQSEEQLAINYYRDRQFDKAVLLLKPLFEEKHSQYLYLYYLNCLLELKEYKEAEKVVKKQRKEFPDNFRYLIDQAYIFDQQDEKKKANNLF